MRRPGRGEPPRLPSASARRRIPHGGRGARAQPGRQALCGPALQRSCALTTPPAAQLGCDSGTKRPWPPRKPTPIPKYSLHDETDDVRRRSSILSDILQSVHTMQNIFHPQAVRPMHAFRLPSIVVSPPTPFPELSLMGRKAGAEQRGRFVVASASKTPSPRTSGASSCPASPSAADSHAVVARFRDHHRGRSRGRPPSVSAAGMSLLRGDGRAADRTVAAPMDKGKGASGMSSISSTRSPRTRRCATTSSTACRHVEQPQRRRPALDGS